MTIQDSLFQNAELSVASYATLALGPTGTDANIAALIQAGMSATQAAEFAARYPTVVAYYDDRPNTDFQVAVFSDAAGNLTVAPRGTEVPQDLPTDADIALAGAAYDQIVAMVNWWLRASATTDQAVQQFRLATFPADSVPADAVVIRTNADSTVFALANGPVVNGTGELASALALDPDFRVDVTGHSLGGHLAMAFSSVFASKTGAVTVFNAPGFLSSSINQAFFAKLGSAIPTSASIVNVAADEALVDSTPFNLIAGLWSRPGIQIDIAIEKQTNSDEPKPFGALNHSIIALDDSLAVYKLLADLDPALSTADYKVILNQAAMFTSASLERIVDTLESLFAVNDELLPNGNGAAAREALYQAITGLSKPGTGNTLYQLMRGALRIAPSVDDAPTLLTQMQNATGADLLAYRYALTQLNPFVVFDSNGSGFYTRFQTGGANGGELDDYDATNNRQGLTQTYLQDRAAFLERKLYITEFTRNQFYEEPGVSDPGSFPNSPDARGQAYQREAKEYLDLASRFVASTGGRADSLQHYVFGGTGADVILGAGREDHLYGGAGTDYLQGKAADDYLEAGLGLDLYNYGVNDGDDTILDADGSGVLRYTFTDNSGNAQSTVIAEASVKLSETQWTSADGKFAYTKQGNDLVVTINGDAGGSLTLKDWREGDFGIRLWQARTAPQFTDTQNVVPGGNDDANNLTGTAASDLILAFGGNDRVSGGAGDDIIDGGTGDDTLDGQGDNDRIYGDVGDDSITGGLGDDELYGGDGRDFISDAGGATLVEGGAGTDIAFSFGFGKDEFYADTTVTLASAITNGEQAGSGLKGDWLMTGADDDLAVGGTGDDVLMGGGGSDILVGGAGDDDIEGDLGWVTNTFDWTATRTATTQPDGSTLYQLIYDPAVEIDATAGGNDVIYAGSGADWVRAGVGEDFVDAGSGDDKVWGEAGSDVLIGGLGNDVLVGDNPGFVTGADEGGDYLDGGAGNDNLQGNGGSDILIGGPGDDTLSGGTGKDIYVFARGDGKDTVFDPDDASNGPDASVLVLGDGISRSDIKFRIGSLGVDIGPSDPTDPNSTHEVIHFAGFDQLTPTNTTPISEIRFADGTSMSYADILAQGFDIDGTEDSDDNHDAAHPQIQGTGVTDRIRGLGGNDIILGLAGDDSLDGGLGNDLIAGGAGNDLLLGGAGIDRLQGGSGNDNLQGGDDNDQLFGDADDATDMTSGNDVLDGGAGDDFLAGNAGNDTLYGGDGADNLQGQTGADVIEGGAGNDFLYGDGVYFFNGQSIVNLFDDGASDILRGGAGDDQLDAGAGDDVLEGGAGADTVFGGAGNDHLEGGSEDDLLFGDFNTETAQDGNDMLLGGDGNDQLVGNGGNDTLDGGAGADSIFGGTGNDALTGGDGNDTLDGGAGADTLAGSAGDDTLYGEGGNDTYVFNLGDGRDTIIEDSTVNTEVLRFGPGIVASDLTFSKILSDLVISHANGTDQVTVQGWYAGNGFQMTTLEFADGSKITGSDATIRGFQLQIGTAGNDIIGGTSGNDTLSGLAGNDFIGGNGGNDVLIGGTGDDILDGGAGVDTYLFDLGDGQDRLRGGVVNDTLRFGTGIASSAISYRRVGNDLVMSHSNGTDKVTVEGWYVNNFGTSQLGSVVFESDGTVLTGAQLSTAGTVINDSYTLNVGDGAKLIEDWGGNDILTFGAGLTKSAIAPTRVGQDLILTRSAVPTDKVTIKGWFNDVNEQIETVTFSATGESFTHSELTDPFLTLTGTAGADTLTGGDAYGETINGLAGNDTLSGGGGDDQITGGLGNDSLQGGLGNDRYFFKSGDGQDTLFDAGGSNVLEFGPGMVNNVAFVLSGNDVVVTFSGSTDSVRFLSGTTGAISKFELNGTNNADTITGSSFGDVIQGLGGNDVIHGGDGADEIYGGPGNDTLEGGGSDTDGSVDALYGGDGDDTLDSGLLTDSGDVGGLLTGGPGNDMLFGSSGRDSYFFNLGDGLDTINDQSFFGNGQILFSTADAVIFGPGITKDSISARFSGTDMIVQVTPTDAITMKNWTNLPTRVDTLRFADGTFMSDTALQDLALTLKGTSGNDTLTGTSANEILLGFAGNDTLLGMGGDDRLTGGTGDDSLQGGSGNDTYFINSGDGRDTITETSGTDTLQYGAGITASGITLSRNVNGLVLSVNGTSDSVTIANYLIDPNARVENFVFADGSQLPTQAQILDQLINVRGTAGDDVLTGTAGYDVLYGFDGNDTLTALGDNDTLFGGTGNDILIGGTGNDNLQGEGGDDTYQYAVGDGNDVVSDTSGFDAVVFGSGIATSAVTPGRNLTDLFLNVNVTGNPGKVTVLNYFNGQETEQIKFADGTIWDGAAVRAKVLVASQTSGNDTVYGYDTADTINALAGDDTVFGGAGNDTIDGGTGSDTLYGEDGDDTINAGSGDANNASVVNNLYGGNGNDVFVASGKPDNLYGGAGNDVYRGAAGNDLLEDAGGGNGVMDGQAGVDTFHGSDGNDGFIGGAGNDVTDGDFDANGIRGRDIVLFNKSDGADTASRLGSGSTLSIGGGTLYSNLSLSVSGNSLILTAGTGTATFTDWYSGNKAVSTLQMVIEGTRDYSATSTNPMNNKKIQEFDFLGLVNAFDAARAAGQTFNVANNLANFRLSGSDTLAYGGAIAYQYGKNGTLGALANSYMQAVISAPEFGSQPQDINGVAGLSALASEGSTATQYETSSTTTPTAVSVDASAQNTPSWAAGQEAAQTGAASAAPTPQGGESYESHTPEEGLRQDIQARIDRWFDQAQYRQAYSLSDFEQVRNGTLSAEEESGEYSSALGNLAQWNQISRSLPAHLARYADVGLDLDAGDAFSGALLSSFFGSGQPVVNAVGLRSVTGVDLKPLEGLQDGVVRLG